MSEPTPSMEQLKEHIMELTEQQHARLWGIITKLAMMVDSTDHGATERAKRLEKEAWLLLQGQNPPRSEEPVMLALVTQDDEDGDGDEDEFDEDAFEDDDPDHPDNYVPIYQRY